MIQEPGFSWWFKRAHDIPSGGVRLLFDTYGTAQDYLRGISPRAAELEEIEFIHRDRVKVYFPSNKADADHILRLNMATAPGGDHPAEHLRIAINTRPAGRVFVACIFTNGIEIVGLHFVEVHTNPETRAEEAYFPARVGSYTLRDATDLIGLLSKTLEGLSRDGSARLPFLYSLHQLRSLWMY
jgi:hypothetical protein